MSISSWDRSGHVQYSICCIGKGRWGAEVRSLHWGVFSTCQVFFSYSSLDRRHEVQYDIVITIHIVSRMITVIRTVLHRQEPGTIDFGVTDNVVVEQFRESIKCLKLCDLNDVTLSVIKKSRFSRARYITKISDTVARGVGEGRWCSVYIYIPSPNPSYQDVCSLTFIYSRM